MFNNLTPGEATLVLVFAITMAAIVVRDVAGDISETRKARWHAREVEHGHVCAPSAPDEEEMVEADYDSVVAHK